MAVAVFVYALAGLPYAYLIDRGHAFFSATRRVAEETVFEAYWWTCYACVALVVAFYLLRMPRLMQAYIARSSHALGADTVRRAWIGAFGGSLVLVGVMFYQAKYRFPLLESRHIGFDQYAYMRMVYTNDINQTVFTFAFAFASLALVLALFFMAPMSWVKVVASVAPVVLVSLFTLAKSPVAAGLIVLVNVYCLVRPVRRATLMLGLGISVAVVAPWYFFSDTVTNANEMGGTVLDRSLYGEWTGFPYYLDVFDHSHVSVLASLPPYLQFFGDPGPSPGRIIMIHLSPEAVRAGVAGTAPTFFLGEAYAIWGEVGMILAPFVAMGEMWLTVQFALRAPKNGLTVYLLAWILFRFTLGLVLAASAFIISGATFGIAMLGLLAFLARRRQPIRVPAEEVG